MTTMPTPSPQPLAWQEAELGVVFHYDLHVFEKTHYNQVHNRRHAIRDVNIFNPTSLQDGRKCQELYENG